MSACGGRNRLLAFRPLWPASEQSSRAQHKDSVTFGRLSAEDVEVIGLGGAWAYFRRIQSIQTPEPSLPIADRQSSNSYGRSKHQRDCH